jgi:hypothetical protein
MRGAIPRKEIRANQVRALGIVRGSRDALT